MLADRSASRKVTHKCCLDLRGTGWRLVSPVPRESTKRLSDFVTVRLAACFAVGDYALLGADGRGEEVIENDKERNGIEPHAEPTVRRTRHRRGLRAVLIHSSTPLIQHRFSQVIPQLSGGALIHILNIRHADHFFDAEDWTSKNEKDSSTGNVRPRDPYRIDYQ